MAKAVEVNPYAPQVARLSAVIDEALGDDLRITIIATGFQAGVKVQPRFIGEDKTIEFPTRAFESDNLEVPAFLRRR